MTRRTLVIAAIALLAVAAGLMAATTREQTAGTAETPAPGAERQAPAPRAPVPGSEARTDPERSAPSQPEAIRWRRSQAVGLPFAGRLVEGVKLPAEGRDFFTWDPIRRTTPNRGWRRHGTDRLLRLVLRVLAEHRRVNPGAPRVGVGDISRPHGGDFGPRFGGIGHASHQNGLDVDVYYPREDRWERRASRPSQIDHRLAQDLVDRFVRAGARYVFVGPATSLRGPRAVVQPLFNHDDHLHVRLPADRGG